MEGVPVSDKVVRNLAEKSDHRWAHHVAIITRGRVIVAVGYNKGTIHAEEMAIRKMLFLRERGSRLYSVRIRRDGRNGASKPCLACERVIRDAGIRYVFFSDYDGNQERMMLV